MEKIFSLYRLIVVGFTIFIITGCAKSFTSNPLDGKSNPEESAKAIIFHGEFCGPNHPSVKTETKLGNVIALLTIQPLDNLDAACQRHDICYDIFRWGDGDCDTALVREVNELHFQENDSIAYSHCLSTKNTIIGVSPATLNLMRVPIVTLLFPVSALLGVVNEYTIEPLNKTLNVLTAIQNNKYENISPILNHKYICNAKDNNVQIFYDAYHLFYIRTLITKLINRKYITLAQLEQLHLNVSFLTQSTAQDYFQGFEKEKSKILNYFSNPVLLEEWSL